MRFKLETLSDLSRRGYWLRIICQACEHTREIDPAILGLEVHKRGKSQKLDDLEYALRCSVCGGTRSHLLPFERG